MRLSQLEYLDAIARCGTFSKAAQALYLSQPSLSVGVRELEEELGYPLLVRGGKQLTFTPEGARVLAHAQKILRELDGIRRIAPGGLCGTVAVGGTPHFCNSLMLDVMMNLKARHPQLQLVLTETDSVSALEMVRAGQLQIGLVQLCDLDEDALMHEHARGTVRCDALFDEEMCCAVGEGHPLAGCAAVTVDALLEYPYATYRRALCGLVVRLMRRRGLGEERIARLEEIDLLRRYIFRTNSFTVIPRRALWYGNSSFAGNFIVLPVAELTWTTRVAAVRAARDETAEEQAVLTALLAQCQAYQE